MSHHDPRVVLVTGGSRGVGRALVDAFRQSGCKVAATATSAAGAKSIDADLALVCDVSDKEAVGATVGAVIGALGRLDVVVNNAGIAGENSLDPDDDDALWHRIVDVNLHGTYYVTKHCLPHLPDGVGRIINIASVLAQKGVPDQTAYCAAKHGVLGFTRALALKLAPRGITVNAICPGWVRTDMAEQRASELGTTVENLATGVVLGRMVEPEEVAAMAVYLASHDASMITGQALTIDGGGPA